MVKETRGRRRHADRFGLDWRVSRGEVELAKSRTDFLVNRVLHFDMPLKLALANAWAQGVADAIEAVDGKTTDR
jgi:hypothetical protein